MSVKPNCLPVENSLEIVEVGGIEVKERPFLIPSCATMEMPVRKLRDAVEMLLRA